MYKVFISSPYTMGYMPENLQKHFECANKLLDNGIAVFSPLLFHYLEIQKTRPYDFWLKIDQEWLQQCDAVLRLPGESNGAEIEVALAKEKGIPVFYSLDKLFKEIEKNV